MKALSVWQPWAWLIVNGYKHVENRTWILPEAMAGQRIYVHASKREDWTAWRIIKNKHPEIWAKISQDGLVVNEGFRRALPRGYLVGEVTLKSCGWGYPSGWAEPDYWQWILADPVAFEIPIPCRGRQGLFEVEMEKKP